MRSGLRWVGSVAPRQDHGALRAVKDHNLAGELPEILAVAVHSTAFEKSADSGVSFSESALSDLYSSSSSVHICA